MLLVVKIPVAYKQRFAMGDDFYLTQIVAHQRATRTYNVEYAIGKTNTWANLHAARNYMYISVYSVLAQVFT